MLVSVALIFSLFFIAVVLLLLLILLARFTSVVVFLFVFLTLCRFTWLVLTSIIAVFLLGIALCFLFIFLLISVVFAFVFWGLDEVSVLIVVGCLGITLSLVLILLRWGVVLRRRNVLTLLRVVKFIHGPLQEVTSA